MKVQVNGELEDFNPNGKQSDGSQFFMPKPVVDANHEHYFALANPGERIARCVCGMGGMVYPHNARIIDGHIYKLDGTKVI